jgi:Baseplate J-like protein
MTIAENTITELVKIGTDAVKGYKDINADTRTGSIYEHVAGSGAILWSREQHRDTDLFRSIRFADAENDELTDYVLKRFNIQRQLDTYGTGVATFVRGTTANGAGTFRAGTRLMVASDAKESTFYSIASDVAVSSGATLVQIPIQFTKTGPGGLIDTSTAILADPVWDTNWVCTHLTCTNGLAFEQADTFRSRVRQTVLDNRVGFEKFVRQTCFNAGASQVFLFPSNYNGTDNGLNVIYVGDAGYNSTPALITNCLLALEAARVCGDQMQVLGMSPVPVSFNITIHLWADPSGYNTVEIGTLATGAITKYFQRNKFQFNRNAMGGEIRRLIGNIIQDVTFNSPSSDTFITYGGHWQSNISAFFTNSSLITISYAGPT